MVLPQENATAGTVVTGTPKVAHSIDMPILPAPHGETNQTPDGHQECRRAGEKGEPDINIARGPDMFHGRSTLILRSKLVPPNLLSRFTEPDK